MTVRDSAAIRVLLVSAEGKTIDILCDVMEQLHIHVEVCPEVQAAIHKLQSSKYEGVIVDLLQDRGLELLQSLPEFASNSGVVSCAILPDAQQKASAFRSGANFVLAHPVDRHNASRTIQAAYPMMVRERRRYRRHPAQTTAFVTREQAPEFQAVSVNVGETGMALLSPVPLEVGQKLQIRLGSSGKTNFLTVTGEVRWTNPSGKTGVQFAEATAQLGESLEAWLRRNSKKCRTKPVPRSHH